jgi:pSer/pThr/pTyr-binding forkhead associated (FHA) protein
MSVGSEDFLDDVTCPGCGHVGTPGDRFCSRCGTLLPGGETTFIGIDNTPSTGSLPAVGTGLASDIPVGDCVLVVLRGAGEGSTYLLTGDLVTAGRAPDSDLFLDDVTVSRNHAEFRRQGAGWNLRDVGSLNGTYVNRQRVDMRELVGGDEVQIGKYRFVFLVGGAAGGG